jgi:small subunit ribosomal protein S2
VNQLSDKALQQEAAPEQAAAPESEDAAPVEAAESSTGEEVDLEAALGGGIRKAPAAVAALLEEAEVAAEGGD